MKRIGIYDYFTKPNLNEPICNISEKAIPFNRISNEDKMEEFTDKIMKLAPINMESKAKDILSSYFYEIYQNAFFHSQSPIDVFSSGYWMPERKELIFSIYDMGIGIPQNIRNHIKEEMTDIQCIEWAFTEGKSTIEDKFIKRGLGLSRLETFIKINHGSLSLYSQDICCLITDNSKKFFRLSKPIKGTLIIVNIKADNDHIYIVKS